MPKGLNNSPGLTGSGGIIGLGSTPNTGLVPRKAINYSMRMIFTASGVPQPSQALRVPANTTVYIRAHNGTPTGNAAPCRVALSAAELSQGSTSGDVITPDTEISYPVDNLCQIWAAGTLGDGIILSIRAGTTQ
jgi:hypothetical protein